MKGENTNGSCYNEFFFPPIILERSTKQFLYSKNTSSQFGRGAKVAIYFSALPSPKPKAIKMMVFRNMPKSSGKWIFELKKKSEHPTSNVVQYDNLQSHKLVDFNSVYLPENMVGKPSPNKVFVEIDFVQA
jgi:hypothetical protein